MDNEATSTIIPTDQTDTQSQSGKKTDNASRHSSRVGSARSERSKATSGREATTIDDTNRKGSGAAQSPKPNGERQGSPTLLKSKPPSPTIPTIAPGALVDTSNGDFNDDLNIQDEVDNNAEIEAIVRETFV